MDKDKLEEAINDDGMIGAASDGVPVFDHNWNRTNLLTLEGTKGKMYSAQNHLTQIVKDLANDEVANHNHLELLTDINDALLNGINFLEHIERVLEKIRDI